MAGAFSSAFSSAFDVGAGAATATQPAHAQGGMIARAEPAAQYLALAGPVLTPAVSTVPDGLAAYAGWAPTALRRLPIAAALLLAASVGPILPQPNPAAPDGTAAYATSAPVRALRARYQAARFLPAAVGNLLPIASTGPDAPAAPPSATGLVRRLPRLQIQQVAAPVPHTATIVGLEWAPTDGVRPRAAPPRPSQAWAAPPQAPITAPPDPVGWEPVVPRTVLVARRPPILVARQQAYAQTLPVQPNPPAPDRSWAGWAPDAIARARTLPIAAAPRFAQPIVPILTPAPTSAMWAPWAPDRTLRAPSRHGLLGGNWLPPLADATVEDTQLIEKATLPPWPLRRPYPTALWAYPAGVWTALPSPILGGAVGCLHWRDTTVTHPRLVDEALTVATATGRLTTPDAPEDLC